MSHNTLFLSVWPGHFNTRVVGFFSWPSVYSGHQSILIPPLELESSLPVWLSTLSQYKIRDTFCSYSVMELCTKGLGTQTEMLKVGVVCTQNNSATYGFPLCLQRLRSSFYFGGQINVLEIRK